MKQFVPDYYFNFQCLMGDCAHTCCEGWEIDIDEDAMARYRAQGGEFGETLKKHIDEENGCFRLTEGNRCPFLNEKGLCEIIIRLGEGALCQICDDHPRFRTFFSDRVEIGLGLCCEAAARLILTRTEPMKLTELEDDGEEAFSLSDEERAVLSFRDECLGIAQSRAIPLDERIGRLSALAGESRTQTDAEELIRFFLTLEVMNADWTKRLKALLKAPVRKRALSKEWEIPFEQLLCYMIFRLVSGAAEDGETKLRLKMALRVTELLRAMLFCAPKPCMADFLEIARLYSSEIEYSDENPQMLTEFFNCETTEFEDRVYAYVRSIPKGKVATYGDVAKAIGCPGGARAVGNALHRNPDPDWTPCFRILNSKGETAEHFGDGGREGQKRRLEEDGIHVVEGKVELGVYRA